MRTLKLAIVLMIGLSVIAVFGQQKPSEPKPVTLSLEASQRFVEYENEKARLRVLYGQADKGQESLMIGAGLTAEQRQAIRDWQGQGKPPWTVEGQQIVIPVVEKPKP